MTEDSGMFPTLSTGDFLIARASALRDNSAMADSLKMKVEKRLAELDRNPFEAARAGELERGFINDILQGKKRSVRGENLNKLARALDWSAADLLDPSPENPSQLRLPKLKTLPIRFEVAAGSWMAADEFREEPLGYYEEAQLVEGYDQFPQWLERVVGDSYDRKIPDGALVHVVDAIALGYAPRHGDTVLVVRRRAQGAFVERSLKEVVQAPFGVELWPRSHNPKWDQPLNYADGLREGEDAEVQIVGKVLRAYLTL